MQSRSTTREIALLILGQVSFNQIDNLEEISLEDLMSLGLDTLINHWRDQLDASARNIEFAKEKLLDIELEDTAKIQISKIRTDLENSLIESENVINSLSDCLELSRLISLSPQQEIRKEAIKRVALVLKDLNRIDCALDQVMEGWRLKRLPRIDQDILRLAYIDICNLNTPIAVASNEAVNLAHRYSDEQGRKMINGILRRLHTSLSTKIA